MAVFARSLSVSMSIDQENEIRDWIHSLVGETFEGRSSLLASYTTTQKRRSEIKLNFISIN